MILSPKIGVCYNSRSRLGEGNPVVLLERDNMPVYEYRCGNCGRKVTLYQRSFEAPPSSPCTACGSSDLKRIFSTFAVHKTYMDVYEDILGDKQLVNRMMANDPRALADWNRRMSRDDTVAPEYEDMVGRMDAGEWPSELSGGGSSKVVDEGGE